MFPRTLLALGLLIGAGVALSQSAVAEVAVDAALMKVLDPDADGTVDLKEAQAAGAAMFKKLNPDDDGTLDAKELYRPSRRSRLESGRSGQRRHARRRPNTAPQIEKLFNERQPRQRRHARREGAEVCRPARSCCC